MAEMQRYAALLRGLMPTNGKMSELKRSFEAAGFHDVKTVLGSGNVLFSAPAAAESTLARKAERAMTETLGRSFMTFVRSVDALRKLLKQDPFAGAKLPKAAKRVVTFLPGPLERKVALPAEVDGARIVSVRGSEVFSAYTPSPRGPVFMTLIKKTFGDDVTTRTWDTIVKVAADGPSAASKKSTRKAVGTTRASKAKSATKRKKAAKRKAT
jgi:uncharacterized protein (DUF1697 family)